MRCYSEICFPAKRGGACLDGRFCGGIIGAFTFRTYSVTSSVSKSNVSSLSAGETFIYSFNRSFFYSFIPTYISKQTRWAWIDSCSTTLLGKVRREGSNISYSCSRSFFLFSPFWLAFHFFLFVGGGYIYILHLSNPPGAFYSSSYSNKPFCLWRGQELHERNTTCTIQLHFPRDGERDRSVRTHRRVAFIYVFIHSFNDTFIQKEVLRKQNDGVRCIRTWRGYTDTNSKITKTHKLFVGRFATFDEAQTWCAKSRTCLYSPISSWSFIRNSW